MQDINLEQDVKKLTKPRRWGSLANKVLSIVGTGALLGIGTLLAPSLLRRTKQVTDTVVSGFEGFKGGLKD